MAALIQLLHMHRLVPKVITAKAALLFKPVNVADLSFPALTGENNTQFACDLLERTGGGIREAIHCKTWGHKRSETERGGPHTREKRSTILHFAHILVKVL